MTGPSRLVCLAVVAGIGAGHLSASARPQSQEQDAAPVFRTGVDVVRVDVSVSGRDGQAVADLQAPDFELREEGVIQRIQSAQFIRLDGVRRSDRTDSMTIRSAEHAAREARRDDVRAFAIFLDDYHVDKHPQITIRAREAMKAFVRQFGPNDIVAVMDPLTPLSHLRFTRDLDEVAQRMAEFEGRRFQAHPVRSAIEEAQLMRRDIWEVRGEVSLSALEALVTYLGGLGDGRKSVLFVSQGPTVGRFRAESDQRIEAVLRAANRGNVTIHAFDPRPLGRAPFGGATTLARLAAETGGRRIVNVNEPDRLLAQTVADASAYYLLGYEPERPVEDGGFRRIDVRVKRRGLDVRSRRGYWADRPAPAPAPVVPAEPGLSEALSALATPEGGRAAGVWIGASRLTGALTRLTLVWEAAGAQGGADVDRLDVEVQQGALAADGTDTVVTMSASTPAVFGVAAGAPTTLLFTARDIEGDVLDRWTRVVDVPAFAPGVPALATPRVLRAQSAFEARRLREDPDPVPTATRRFRRSDVVLVDVDAYAPDASPSSLQASLLNAEGTRLVDLDGTSLGDGRTRFTLPLASLAPAVYVLRIVGPAEGSGRELIAFSVGL